MIPETMTAVVLTGYGGPERLAYRSDLPTPQPGPGEVLIAVAAAGMNNTDINTRVGWYNSDVGEGTTSDGARDGLGVSSGGMGDWTGDIVFPRIQGADCVGRIVAVGQGVPQERIGERVICTPCIYDPHDPDWLDKGGYLGAEYDGAFAQFVVLPSVNVLALDPATPFSDAELATLPCSGGTAMNMLLMAGIKAGDLVLVTGASGGVGSFLVQIACHLGAEVVAVCSPAKAEEVLALGALATVDRKADDYVKPALAATGGRSFSLIADVAGGPHFPQYLALLRRGGRYVTAGAIAGPQVALDLRTVYLKNLSFFGSTVHLKETIPSLLKVLAEGGLKPAVAATRPLSEIHAAQEAFLRKDHVGSMVLIPPPVAAAP
ncbi:MAG: alcohol dehydrogenase family protein [Rhodospirillales bacterium]